jgi:hypothetical protein
MPNVTVGVWPVPPVTHVLCIHPFQNDTVARTQFVNVVYKFFMCFGKIQNRNFTTSTPGRYTTVSFPYRCHSQTECVGAEWQV